MRAVALFLGGLALSALLWGCTGERVRCDTRLRPINLVPPTTPVRTHRGVAP
jgi:hypothetical protein